MSICFINLFYQDLHVKFFLHVYLEQLKLDVQVKFDVQALGSIVATVAFVATVLYSSY